MIEQNPFACRRILFHAAIKILLIAEARVHAQSGGLLDLLPVNLFSEFLEDFKFRFSAYLAARSTHISPKRVRILLASSHRVVFWFLVRTPR